MTSITGVFIFLLSFGFRSCVTSLPTQNLQHTPSKLVYQIDQKWQDMATSQIEQTQKQWQITSQKLLGQKKTLNMGGTLAGPSDSAFSIHPTYQKLPEVYVDRLSGAIFPSPPQRPVRFSWYQVTLALAQVESKLHGLENKLQELKAHLTHPEFELLLAQWNALNSEYAKLLQHFRYLKTWSPELTQRSQTGKHFEPKIIHALLTQTPATMNELKQSLRPHRIIKRDFLPATLTPGTQIVIPVSTDIKDKKFKAEIIGALDTFWTHSSWAKSKKVTFKIEWTRVPSNPLFAQGEQTLTQHLSHFPPNKAVMTTGSLATFVQGRALVFGLGKITPRTIAHEMGHLLGFSDCYVRTLTSQGIFGTAILEWSNPFYPDELMCDNNVGLARTEVW